MRRAALNLFLCATAPSALAHPNHAGGSPLGADLLHLLTEPDHLALILLPAVVFAAIALMRRRRSRRSARGSTPRVDRLR